MIKKLLREGLVKTNLTEGPVKLFEAVKDYYKLSGDLDEDTHNLNELYVYLKEEEAFNPFSHGQELDNNDVEEKNDCLLSFSNGNAKLDWPYFSLPAGYTCPFATACKTFAAKAGRKFKDGKSTMKGKQNKFKCYAAREQGQYPSLNKKVFTNLSLLMTAAKNDGVEGMAQLIIESIEYHKLQNSKIFRIHESGDFFSANYFKAWIMVANHFPGTTFYTHTTSLEYWIANKGSMPKNMNLVASMDDDNQELIERNGLRYAKVVYSVEEAQKLRLKIDYDDRLACCSPDSFAILIHGQQDAGSDASKAVSANKDTYAQMKKLHAKDKPIRQNLLKNK